MTTALAKTSIKQLIQGDAFRQQVTRALPTHLKPDRFIRIALTTIMRTPKLAECDQASFLNSLLTLSQLGIEPDGRRAHLIPFENRKRRVTECQLIIDYKGLAELAMRSGAVSNIHADVVCEADAFEYDCGEIKTHRIDFKRPRGAVYAVYALCRFKDGTVKADVMSRDDIEAIRKRSRAGENGPWVTDWNEMAKKTVFRRLTKWLPLSAEFRDATEADEEIPAVEAGPINDGPLVEVLRAVEIPEEEEKPEDASNPEVMPTPTPPTPPQPVATVTQKPQDALRQLVEGNGFTFDTFAPLAERNNWVQDCTSYTSFDEIPTDRATALLRPTAGIAILKALETMKKGGNP